MAKKKSKARGSSARERKLAPRLEELVGEGPSAIAKFVEGAPPSELRELFDAGFSSDLVNVLLDLKRSTVRTFFERAMVGRKRTLAPIVALYHYKLYLTNPLPLDLEATNGETHPNHYAILGVPRDASQEDLDEAHKLLSKAFSPESFAEDDRPAGELRRREIVAAFKALRTEENREDTDRLLPNMGYYYPKREDCWLEPVRQLLN